MTPAGTSNELDVQNGWEENTHTHTYCRRQISTGTEFEISHFIIFLYTPRPDYIHIALLVEVSVPRGGAEKTKTEKP